MRKREIDKELQSIQLQLDKMGKRMIMSATSNSDSPGGQLQSLAFRIGRCRDKLNNKEPN